MAHHLDSLCSFESAGCSLKSFCTGAVRQQSLLGMCVPTLNLASEKEGLDIVIRLFIDSRVVLAPRASP
jgi:hypothetical protein